MRVEREGERERESGEREREEGREERERREREERERDGVRQLTGAGWARAQPLPVFKEPGAAGRPLC